MFNSLLMIITFENVVPDLLLCTPVMLVMYSCYDLLCSPVMTSYVPAHSRNLIIMFNKL